MKPSHCGALSIRLFILREECFDSLMSNLCKPTDRIAYMHRLRRALVFWILAAAILCLLSQTEQILPRIPLLIVLAAIFNLWLAANFTAIGVLYMANQPAGHWKLGNGELTNVARRFWPYLFATSAVWHIWRLLSRQPATTRICDGLTVGRRLIGNERPADVSIVVDLTAEFEEPADIRRGVRYYSFPILDGSAPEPEELLAFAKWLNPSEHVYIHCAQGHGRTGLVALAVLLERNVVVSIDEGLALLKSKRPGISLSASQRHCIETMMKLRG